MCVVCGVCCLLCVRVVCLWVWRVCIDGVVWCVFVFVVV